MNLISRHLIKFVDDLDKTFWVNPHALISVRVADELDHKTSREVSDWYFNSHGDPTKAFLLQFNGDTDVLLAKFNKVLTAPLVKVPRWIDFDLAKFKYDYLNIANVVILKDAGKKLHNLNKISHTRVEFNGMDPIDYPVDQLLLAKRFEKAANAFHGVEEEVPKKSEKDTDTKTDTESEGE